MDIRLGTLPTAIEAHPSGGVCVTLDDGSRVDADTVLVGIGMRPATDLARNAGLAVASGTVGGIVVDAQLRTSAPGVFAAGDVVAFPSALSGQPMRQETWFNAETQARVAALNMLGGQAVCDAPPWFWSDQYDHQLQVAGEPALGTQTVVRDLGDGDRVTFHLNTQDRVVGLSAWGQAPRCLKEVKLARLLVERRVTARPAELADPAVKLKSLAAGSLAVAGVTA